MTEPSLPTLKRLFAFSGNRCAFPQCALPIVEESGVVTGIVCHICARSKGGPRYDARQTAEERHGYGNLIMMCARHSKLIDSDPTSYPVDSLRQMKAAQEKNGSIEISQSDALKAEALLKDYRAVYITAGGHVMLNSPGSIQAEKVTIQQTKGKAKFLPIEGSLGADLVRRNYVKHLIDRYNDFASKQTGRSVFSFAAIYSSIKKNFKADWERIPVTRFDELADFLQGRINRTQLGSINRSKGIKNYSTFEEYRATCS
jgi:hypothetical protein